MDVRCSMVEGWWKEQERRAQRNRPESFSSARSRRFESRVFAVAARGSTRGSGHVTRFSRGYVAPTGGLSVGAIPTST